MKKFKIELSATARRQLKRMDRKTARRIIAKIESLSTNPRPAGYIQIKSSDQRFRVRVGDYRIIYKIIDDALVILVVEIGHRSEIYR